MLIQREVPYSLDRGPEAEQVVRYVARKLENFRLQYFLGHWVTPKKFTIVWTIFPFTSQLVYLEEHDCWYVYARGPLGDEELYWDWETKPVRLSSPVDINCVLNHGPEALALQKMDIDNKLQELASKWA